jgi:RimJ/RimL family protein N-acetyltransferase
MTVLRTERLVLRPPRLSDLEPLHRVFSDPRAKRYWDRAAHGDIALTERFLRWMMRGDATQQCEYVLEFDGVCVGKAGVWGRPEVGFILTPELWGQGLVVEALQAILPRAFAQWPDCAYLTAEADARNAGSIRVLEKLGFARVAYGEKDFLYDGHEWCDTVYHRLSRPG